MTVQQVRRLRRANAPTDRRVNERREVRHDELGHGRRLVAADGARAGYDVKAGRHPAASRTRAVFRPPTEELRVRAYGTAARCGAMATWRRTHFGSGWLR